MPVFGACIINSLTKQTINMALHIMTLFYCHRRRFSKATPGDTILKNEVKIKVLGNRKLKGFIKVKE